MTKTTEESRKKLDGLLAQARDIFLNWSREALQAESDDERWQADVVFAFAKEVDDLRRRVGDVANGAPPLHEKRERDEPATSRGTTGDKKLQAFVSARRRKRDYPKYLRRDNALVKVGLGKDKKSEYKHVVPDAECRRVMELVAHTGGNRKEFTADDILKGFDGPSYRLYIVLALLREKKVIVVVRRGTYKLGNRSVAPTIEGIWKSLPIECHE